MNTCGNDQFPRPVDGRIAINNLLLNELLSQALFGPNAQEINDTLGDLTIRVTSGRRLEVDWVRHEDGQADVRLLGRATLLPPRLDFAVQEEADGGQGAPVLLVEFPMHFHQLVLAVDFLATQAELEAVFPEEVRAGEGASVFNHVEVAFRYVLELAEVGGETGLPIDPFMVPERVPHSVGFRVPGDDPAEWFERSDARWLNTGVGGEATPYGLTPPAVPAGAELLSQSLLTDGADPASPVSRKLQLLIGLVNGDLPMNPPLPGVDLPVLEPAVPGILLDDPPAELPPEARAVERLRQLFRLFSALAGPSFVGPIRDNILLRLGISDDAVNELPDDFVPLVPPVDLEPLTALDETVWTPAFHGAVRLLLRNLGTAGCALHQPVPAPDAEADESAFLDRLTAPAVAQWALLPRDNPQGIPEVPSNSGSWLVVGYTSKYLMVQYLCSVYRQQLTETVSPIADAIHLFNVENQLLLNNLPCAFWPMLNSEFIVYLNGQTNSHLIVLFDISTRLSLSLLAWQDRWNREILANRNAVLDPARPGGGDAFTDWLPGVSLPPGVEPPDAPATDTSALSTMLATFGALQVRFEQLCSAVACFEVGMAPFSPPGSPEPEQDPALFLAEGRQILAQSYPGAYGELDLLLDVAGPIATGLSATPPDPQQALVAEQGIRRSLSHVSALTLAWARDAFARLSEAFPVGGEPAEAFGAALAALDAAVEGDDLTAPVPLEQVLARLETAEVLSSWIGVVPSDQLGDPGLAIVWFQDLRAVLWQVVWAHAGGLASVLGWLAEGDGSIRMAAGSIEQDVSVLDGALAAGVQGSLAAAAVSEVAFLEATGETALQHLVGSITALSRAVSRLAASSAAGALNWAVFVLESNGASQPESVAGLRLQESELSVWAAALDEVLAAVFPNWSERVDHFVVLCQAAFEEALVSTEGVVVDQAEFAALERLRSTYDVLYRSNESLRQAWDQAFNRWGRRVVYPTLPLGEAPSVVFLPAQYLCDGGAECACDEPAEAVEWAVGTASQLPGPPIWPLSTADPGWPSEPTPAQSLLFGESWEEMGGVPVARIQQSIGAFSATRNSEALLQAGLPAGSVRLNAVIDVSVRLTTEGKALVNALSGAACTVGPLLDVLVPGLGWAVCSWAATTAALLTVADKQILTKYAQEAEGAPESVPFRLSLSPRVEAGRACIWRQMEAIPNFEDIAELSQMAQDAVDDLTEQMRGNRVELPGLPAPLPAVAILEAFPHAVPYFFPAVVVILGRGFEPGATQVFLTCPDAAVPEIPIETLLVHPNVIIVRIQSVSQGQGPPDLPPDVPSLFPIEIAVDIRGQRHASPATLEDALLVAQPDLQDPTPPAFSSADITRVLMGDLPILFAGDPPLTEPPLARNHVIPLWAVPDGRMEPSLRVEFAHEEGVRFFRFAENEPALVEEVPTELATASAHLACVAHTTEVPGFLVPLQAGVYALNGCQLLELAQRPPVTVSPASSALADADEFPLVPNGVALVAPGDALQLDPGGIPIESTRSWLLVLPWGEHVQVVYTKAYAITVASAQIVVDQQNHETSFDIFRSQSNELMYSRSFGISALIQTQHGRFILEVQDEQDPPEDGTVGLPGLVRVRYRWFVRHGAQLLEIEPGIPLPGENGEILQAQPLNVAGIPPNDQNSILSVLSDRPPSHVRIVCRREPLELSAELGNDVFSGDRVEEEIEISLGWSAGLGWGVSAFKHPPLGAPPMEVPILPNPSIPPFGP